MRRLGKPWDRAIAKMVLALREDGTGVFTADCLAAIREGLEEQEERLRRVEQVCLRVTTTNGKKIA